MASEKNFSAWKTNFGLSSGWCKSVCLYRALSSFLDSKPWQCSLWRVKSVLWDLPWYQLCFGITASLQVTHLQEYTIPPLLTLLHERRFVVPFSQGLHSCFPHLSDSPIWLSKRIADKGVPDCSATYPLTSPPLDSFISSNSLLHSLASLLPGEDGQKIGKSLVWPPSFLYHPTFLYSFCLLLSSRFQSLGRYSGVSPVKSISTCFSHAEIAERMMVSLYLSL